MTAVALDATSIPDATDSVPDAVTRPVAAERLVSRYVMWGAGAGLVPLPGLDVLAITGVQMTMLHGLSKLYGVPFSQTRAKALVTALLGSVVSYNLAAGTRATVGLLVRAIPVVGPLLSVTVLPAFAAAVTYATGKVFIQHFESGGTLLDFKPELVREYFRREFEAAKSGGTTAASVAPDTTPVTTPAATPATGTSGEGKAK